MIRYFLSLIFLFSVVSSTLASSAWSYETNSCCCPSSISNSNNISIKADTAAETIANDSSCCCSPIPNNKLPDTVFQIQVSPINAALPAAILIKVYDLKFRHNSVSRDARTPLHLASNEVYLKKRALLI